MMAPATAGARPALNFEFSRGKLLYKKIGDFNPQHNF